MAIPCLVSGPRRYPPGCYETSYSVRYVFRRVEKTWRIEENYCVDKEFKAVWPRGACELLDMVADGKPVKAILLGPPGTGKSLLIKRVMSVWPFTKEVIVPEALKSKFYGETESNLLKVLARIEASEPSMLIVDEADNLIMSREEGMGVEQEVRRGLVNILLRKLQEWTDEKRQIGVIMSSNLPIEKLDRALIRAGRISTVIYFPPPTVESVTMLAQLLGREIDESKAMELVLKSPTYSNIVEYLETGKLREYDPFEFARILYPEKPVKITRHLPDKIIVAEDPPLAEKLAAVIAAAVHGKPLLLLLDIRRIREIEWIARSSGYPIAVYDTTYAIEERQWIATARAPVILLGKRWRSYIAYKTITAKELATMVTGGERALAQAICSKCSSLRDVYTHLS